MFSFLIAITVGLLVGLGLFFGGVCGVGWSIGWSFLAFVVVQIVVGRIVQKRVKAAMDAVQAVLLDGQKRLQAKMARWQMRPPGSIQAAQAEIARDQKVFVREALEQTELLHKFDNWVPMMRRQIATAQFQLYWMIKEFKKVDELMPKALFFDPTMSAMKLARMYMTNRPVEEMAKVYAKATRRLRYNQNVLLAAAWSWILIQKKDVDGAFKALNAALEKSDNETLKANRDHLANNRVAHFSNTALGDQWYALLLEEPRIHQQRMRPQWR
ncbi:MAG: hypothetical protein IJL17_19455 [Kiritimatiellae bacterium]|nr:hypothetical protein [Kiritimatiellia bacterium]